jgi:molecular chaperone GrpE
MSMEENQATQNPGATPENAAAEAVSQVGTEQTNATGAEANAAPVDAVQALAQAQAAAVQAKEDHLRTAAELENTRRRAKEELEKAHKFAIERFAEHLLPVIDSLEAAAGDVSGDVNKIREGVELTLRQLNNALEKGRVIVINPVGEKFDPHRHQAISMVPADQEPNTVVSVLQKGFLIADRVLRPALVTVAAPK